MRVLSVRVGGLFCLLPLGAVRETLRPLPIAALPGAPPHILGAARVRGALCPVVDLVSLLEETGPEARRWVHVHTPRPLVLAVHAIHGVRELAAEVPAEGLLQGHPAVERIAALDGALAVVLGPARLMDAEAWAQLEAAGA